MQTQTLHKLLQDLEQELLHLGYTKGSMTFYRNRWRKLEDFADRKRQINYSEQLGINFVQEYFGIPQDDFSRTLNQAQTQELRVIRMVGDFQLHHAVLRRYLKHRELLTDPFFIETSRQFDHYCVVTKDYSKSTVGHYIKQSGYFMDYLAAQGMHDFSSTSINTINAYILTLSGFSFKTVEQNICSLRAFFRFLFGEGIIDADFASKMPMVKARKQTSIPSIWTKEELAKLIGAIDRGSSPNTIRSYRDTFKLLLRYFQEQERITPEKITMSCINQVCVISFLDWLETERGCGVTTRNLRLTAVHSFFRYAQAESPESLFHFQKVIAIPIKKWRKKIVEHLTPEGVRLLLAQPDRSCTKGRRDLVMLSTLYDSGARVQELIDLSIGDFIPGANAVLVLIGKGNKTRRVPLMKNTASLLVAYISENHLEAPHKMTYPLFTNSQHNRLTKEGVAYVLGKYAVQAHKISDVVPGKVKCHMLRHSKAVHLLQAGVNLIYIRDFLGHTDIKTTEIYARADTELKRKALENAYPDLVDPVLPDWNNNTELMSWLSSL